MRTLIDSENALEQGLLALCALDSVMAKIVGEGARPPLRKRPPGFPGLVAIVVSQQVSTASAKAIQSRVEARFPALDPATLLAADEGELRACGLSAPKMRTLRAAARAILEGELPLDELHAAPADEAHARLVAVKGIGPWTADIYLLFCLGHPDAFPAGDLALQEAARIAYGLDARPRPIELAALAERWRPWRGVAAKALWTYYGLARSRADPAAAAGA